MLFSQRKGYKPISEIIQRDEINATLRNTLWNCLDINIWQRRGFLDSYSNISGMKRFSKEAWFLYFKEPIDTRSNGDHSILQTIRDYFFTCDWYEVYDFIEFILNYFDDKYLNDFINSLLEKELSAYRYIDNVFTDITSEQEIRMLEEALNDNDFPGVKKHLRQALEHLSNRDNPDYRNSIKESISAVESLARTISANEKATLGDALKVIEKKGKIHPSLQKAFSNLYGYTSDEDGIRHAMLEDPNLSQSDAKFFLLSCTSFINYLKSKM